MKLHENITPDLQSWIEKQHVFFVGTAPLSGDGHVNLSPKGHACLKVLDENTLSYMDMTGSGNETSAHIMENARVTFMWCGFEGPPRILRAYGRGKVVLRDENSKQWKELVSKMDIPLLNLDQQDNVVWLLPFLDYKEE
jgi:hypothetical protein